MIKKNKLIGIIQAILSFILPIGYMYLDLKENLFLLNLNQIKVLNIWSTDI